MVHRVVSRMGGAKHDVPKNYLLLSSSDWGVAHRLANDHGLHPINEVCQHCLVPWIPSSRDDKIVGYIVSTLRSIILLSAIHKAAALRCDNRRSAFSFTPLHTVGHCL